MISGVLCTNQSFELLLQFGSYGRVNIVLLATSVVLTIIVRVVKRVGTKKATRLSQKDSHSRKLKSLPGGVF